MAIETLRRVHGDYLHCINRQAWDELGQFVDAVAIQMPNLQGAKAAIRSPIGRSTEIVHLREDNEAMHSLESAGPPSFR